MAQTLIRRDRIQHRYDQLPKTLQNSNLRNALLMAGGILVTTACAIGYSNDSRYLAWVNRTEEKCAALYGPLPIKTAKQRNEFLSLGYKTYYGQFLPVVFSNQLARQYPNHLLNINCFASSFPKPGIDSDNM